MDKLELREKEPHETVREYAYRVLYQNIMTLKLPPGTAMSEQELSGILKVSRTPVREASSGWHKAACWKYCLSEERLYQKFIPNS